VNRETKWNECQNWYGTNGSFLDKADRYLSYTLKRESLFRLAELLYKLGIEPK